MHGLPLCQGFFRRISSGCDFHFLFYRLHKGTKGVVSISLAELCQCARQHILPIVPTTRARVGDVVPGYIGYPS
jgi:hypothetical protein